MESVSIHRERVDLDASFSKRLGVGDARVILHYAIALIWTAIFYVACLRVAIITRRPILSGLIYGGLVYLITNFVALPLSGVPHTRNAITLASRINGVLALLFCMGLPISLLVRRTLSRTRI
jgi:uncharacterized membrane protein YagU involved in acid resistance